MTSGQDTPRLVWGVDFLTPGPRGRGAGLPLPLSLPPPAASSLVPVLLGRRHCLVPAHLLVFARPPLGSRGHSAWAPHTRPRRSCPLTGRPHLSQSLLGHSLGACCVPHPVPGAGLTEMEETQAQSSRSFRNQRGDAHTNDSMDGRRVARVRLGVGREWGLVPPPGRV